MNFKLFRSAMIVSFGPCLALSVLLFIFAQPIVMIFTSDRELISMATDALRIFIIGFPIIGVKMFYINYFQATHNSMMSCLSSIVGELVFITVTSFLFVQWFGVIGLWAAYPVSELLYLVTVFNAVCIKYRRFPRTIDEILFLEPDFDVPASQTLSMDISSYEHVDLIHNWVLDFCLQQGLSKRMAILLSFASEELVRDIFGYVYKGDRKQILHYCMKLKGEEIVIFMRDEFEPFDPTADRWIPEGDLLTDIGIKTMLKIAQDVKYVAVFNLNSLAIVVTQPDLASSLDA